MRTFLDDRLALNNENASGFPSEPIRSTPTGPPPLSPQASSPVLRVKRLRTRCVARSFRLGTRFQHSSFQVFRKPQNTHIYNACTISRSIKSIMIRPLAVGVPRKQPIISLRADCLAYIDSGPPEPKIIYSTFPARILLPIPPPKHVPLWEAP